MNFVRNRTRLNCDIYNAFRSLTNPDKIGKWTKTVIVELQSVPYNQVKWSLGIDDKSEREGKLEIELEFNLMRCGMKTEYCTEIHLLARLKNSAIFGEEEQTQTDVFSKQLLEDLRFHFNKTRVIQDQDVSTDYYRNIL